MDRERERERERGGGGEATTVIACVRSLHHSTAAEWVSRRAKCVEKKKKKIKRRKKKGGMGGGGGGALLQVAVHRMKAMFVLSSSFHLP